MAIVDWYPFSVDNGAPNQVPNLGLTVPYSKNWTFLARFSVFFFFSSIEALSVLMFLPIVVFASYLYLYTKMAFID